MNSSFAALGAKLPCGPWPPEGRFATCLRLTLLCLAGLAPIQSAHAAVRLPEHVTPLVSEQGLAGLMADATQADQPVTPQPSLSAAEALAARTSLDAEIRLRTSLPWHLAALEPGADVVRSAVFHRERLGARFVDGPVDAHVQLQASGAFGDADPGATQLPTVGLQQAVIRLQAPEVKWLSAEVGRMVLNYGAGRMIGSYDFATASNVFDGLRVRMSYQKYLDVDVVAVKLRRNSTQPDQDRDLFGAYITGQPHERLRADVYVLYLVDGTTAGHAYRTTMGSRLDWRPLDWLSAEVEAAVQVGDEDKLGDADRQSLIGTAFFGELAVHLPVGAGKLSLSPFTQYYSGDPPQSGAASTGTAWQQLYPSLDQVVGLLQLFTQSNLLQNGGRLRWRSSESLSVEFNGRVSSARDNSPLPAFGNPTLAGDGSWRPLGTELDLLLHWQLLRSSEIFLGGGLFVPTGDVEKLLKKATAGQLLLQWTSRF